MHRDGRRHGIHFRSEGIQDGCQGIWLIPVVRIEQGHDFSFGEGYGLVPGRRDSRLAGDTPLRNDLEGTAAFGEARAVMLQQFQRAIGGATVHKEVFVRQYGLCQHSVQRLRERLGGVPADGHEAECGRGHSFFSAS